LSSDMTKKTNKPGNKGTKQSPGPSTVMYRGPIRGGDGAVPDDAITTRMSYNISTTGGTSWLYAVYNTTVSSCPDWASFISTYGEFRILGFEMDYLPHYPGGNTTVVHGSGVRYITHSSDSTSGITMNSAVGHADWKPIHTGERFKAIWRMASEEESQYQSTAAPSSTILGGIAAYVPTASSTAAYGNLVITYLVQFRDRK